MSLVAHLYTMLVCPCHPLLSKVLEQHIAECFAIVGQRLVAIIYLA